ncbi:hypothetical protein CDAR_439241 [Caerostris darwini]|uniref:Uncharacterized protein n=1 Tax=Caerostris darwini TaxID=1538125 RepID=A0AAV4MJ43_9ARAC|nr:hypothetical protein CDAR_439241 [Caerostris darwini]
MMTEICALLIEKPSAKIIKLLSKLYKPPLECESTDQGVTVSCRYRPHDNICSAQKYGKSSFFRNSGGQISVCIIAGKDVYEDGLQRFVMLTAGG